MYIICSQTAIFFFFFFFIHVHIGIYINVFLPPYKKKKKKIPPYLLTFPIWRFCRFLIRWRFSWVPFRRDGARSPIRGLAGARAQCVTFGGLLTCRWCNYTAKQFDALKTKNARKICVFQKNVVSLRQNSEIMKKEHKHKSEESAARERAHQFGQPGGNPICPQSIAANQRAFYRWAETEATEEELRAYKNDKTKPYTRRHFVELLLTKCESMQDVFDLTNQTHGQPKQVIEQTNLPAIEIVLE